MSLVRKLLTLNLSDSHVFFRYLRHSNQHGHATNRDISICVFGPPGSGKTSLINSLFGSAIKSPAVVDVSCPTVGYRNYSVPFENPNVTARVIFTGI